MTKQTLSGASGDGVGGTPPSPESVRLRDLAVRVAGWLAAGDDVEAALFTGSASRGVATPASDIDILLVVADGADRPRSFVEDGLHVELLGRTVEEWRELLSGAKPSRAYDFAFGELLFDKGPGAGLVADSTAVVAHFKAPIELRHELGALLFHIRSKLWRTDEEQAGYWASVVLPTVLDALYVVHDRALPPFSMRLEHLTCVPLTDEHRRLVTTLCAGTLAERAAAACRLADDMIDALGPVPPEKL